MKKSMTVIRHITVIQGMIRLEFRVSQTGHE